MLTYAEDKRLAVLQLAVNYEARIKAACIIANKTYEDKGSFDHNIKVFTEFIETGKTVNDNTRQET